MIAAQIGDLAQLTIDAAKTTAQANLNFAAVLVTKQMPDAAAQLKSISEKLDKVLGAPMAAIATISEALRLVDAIRRRDTEAIIRSAGGVVSGAVQFTLALTSGGGAGASMVILLYVEGIIAMGHLGGILRQIRMERERREVTAITEKAHLVAGYARSMFANYLALFDVVNDHPAEAEFLMEVVDTEARRLGGHMFDLARRLEGDSKKSRHKFPQAKLNNVYSGTSVRTGSIMTGKKDLIRDTLHSTAEYLGDRLHELEAIRESEIPARTLEMKIRWKL